MNTPNEITTIIASQLNKELDLPFRIKLFDEVKLWWARLVANSLERNPQMRVHFSSTIIVPMEAQTDYSISKIVLPRPMELSNLYFDYVGTPDGKEPFTFAPAGTGEYLLSGRYSKLSPSFDIVSQRLLINKPGYDNVLVRAVFGDPSQALTCTDSSCDVWNKPFPITEKVLQQIVEYLVNQYRQKDASGEQRADELKVPAEERQA